MRSRLRVLVTISMALALQSCGSETTISEEREHQEKDAKLLERLQNSSDEWSNPFAQAQTLAEDSMGAAVGSDVDQTWVRKSIEHQEGSARFAQILLGMKPSPDVRRAAERVLADAHTRVQALKRLRKRSIRPDDRTSQPFDGRTSAMFAKMTQIEASSVEQMWAAKMVQYNRGAIALAGVETTVGKDQEVRTYARGLASALANEADNIQQFASERR